MRTSYNKDVQNSSIVEEVQKEIEEIKENEEDKAVLNKSESEDVKLLKKRKVKYIPIKPPKPKIGRVVGTVFIGLTSVGLLVLLTMILYTKWVKYPPRLEIVEEETGIYCLNNWVNSLRIMESTGINSYISKEITYANGSELQENFYKKMLATVQYTAKEANVKNIYGNDYKNKKNEVIVESSPVYEGEAVNLTYIDYDSISFNEDVLKSIMIKYDLKYGDVDYENKLIDIFCEYMCELEQDSIPLKTVDHVPFMMKLAGESKFTVIEEEDEYIDRLLFSSPEFFDLLERFSIASAKVSGVELKPTDEWVKWDSMSDKDKNSFTEPDKYNYKSVISMNWCGAYYLENEYVVKDSNGNVIKRGISAQVGDGSFENPAGLDTDVITVVYAYDINDEEMVEKAYPIRISLREYGVSQDAIDWFESKDIRNRGIDVNSEVQYCYYTFEITNLSDRELIIADNSALCDSNVNTSARTGIIYGLQDVVDLKPDESAIIESWNKSTELNTKYVIWGGDFMRRTEPVWFRLLAGNIDDLSEDKGVTLNKTRDGESTTENIEDISE